MVILLLLFVALWLAANLVITGITIWAVNEIFSFDMPFWPVLCLFLIVAAVCEVIIKFHQALAHLTRT